mmetsp:Transcript_4219/g.9420  ORF Transcript_4219/g.9420 Transcript_4219/m.9420 type:complete len:133 (+) Transcript_4219:316-714(+)
MQGSAEAMSACSESRPGCASQALLLVTMDNTPQYALETKGMEMIQGSNYSVGIQCSKSLLVGQRLTHFYDVLDNSICNKLDSRREFVFRSASECRKLILHSLDFFCLYLVMARVPVGVHQSCDRGLIRLFFY